MSYRDYYRPTFTIHSCTNVVKRLIIINVAVFFLQFIFGNETYYIFGLVPRYVVKKLFLWQPVTYMFLHGNLVHLLLNSFVLYVFGKPLEERWGSRRFLKFYFICGIGAGLIITATSFGNVMPTIGASGAIYGLLAAYAVMFPDARIYLYFLFPIKAKYFVIMIAVISFMSGITNRHSLISHFGHLGGLVVGFVYLKYDRIWDFIKHGMNFRNLLAGNRRKKIFDSWEKEYRRSKISDEAVNRILDKILKEGIESLTPEEKKTMDEYSSEKDTLH